MTRHAAVHQGGCDEDASRPRWLNSHACFLPKKEVESNHFGEEETGVTAHLFGSSVGVLERRSEARGAAALGPKERSALAVDVLGGHRSVTALAQECDVSRKFLYQQADRAQQALERAFSPRRTA